MRLPTQLTTQPDALGDHNSDNPLDETNFK